MHDELIKFDKIKTLSELVWENRASLPVVEAWLESFKKHRDITPQEEANILFALENFLFYGSRLIRELLKAVFRDLYRYNIIKKIRNSNNSTLDTAFIEQAFFDELDRTRFLGVGNPSESGVHLLYLFRQENGLSKSHFINHNEVFARKTETREFGLRYPELKHYIFLDDFCGSGDQATAYLVETVKDIRSLNKDAQISYYCLFGTSAGLEAVLKNTELDSVEAAYELDESFKVFSEESRYFETACPEGVEKQLLEGICKEFGAKLVSRPKDYLGYEDSQLMIGFHHNTPDNTLPIFWCSLPDGSWSPVFKRYHKIY